MENEIPAIGFMDNSLDIDFPFLWRCLQKFLWITEGKAT
jgi:hypothetical protein